ncbi:MAG: hypothetical protein U1F57_06595 [bacterium]
MSETILSRFSQFHLSETASLRGAQSQVDGLVSNFTEEAANGQALLAMTAGSFFYRLGRAGTLALAARAPQASPLLQLASYGIGVGSEVTAFQGTTRLLSTASGDASNPRLWQWAGRGGWAEGLASSFVNFSLLRGAGGWGEGQNVLFQHLFTDLAMVGGNHLAAQMGFLPAQEGTLAQELLQAEAMNLQMGFGMSLVHSAMPSLAFVERSLDLSVPRFERSSGNAESLPNLPPLVAEHAFAGVGRVRGGEGEAEVSYERHFRLNEPVLMSKIDDERPGGGGGSQGGKPVTSDGTASQAPGERQMNTAYNLAGELVRDKLAQQDSQAAARLKRIIRSDVVVVDGTYDHMHLVLDAAKVPFLRTSFDALSDSMLESAKAVFVNCGVSSNVESAQRLARFVERGGLLLTTDWALRGVLEVGFPGFVEFNGKSTRDEVVGIEVANAQDPLFQSFFADPTAKPVWWLENSSQPIRVLSRDKVEVLVRSRELGQRYGDDPVIVRFPYGKGGVYHLLSHFYLQRAEARGARHRTTAVDFATSVGVSENTQILFQRAQKKDPNVDYGTVQSAATSISFVTGVLGQRMKQAEAKTEIPNTTGFFQMLHPQGNPSPAPSLAWKPVSTNFLMDAASGRYRYRMPRDRNEVSIGRQADEVILEDKRLSRRHAVIRRLTEGGETAYFVEAFNFVTIQSGDRVQNLDKGQRGWVLPGDTLYLTPDIHFIFDPQP